MTINTISIITSFRVKVRTPRQMTPPICFMISLYHQCLFGAYLQSIMRLSKLFALASSVACTFTSPFSMSPQPPLYQIIRGEYEDKIRRYSPPEKIFNVFAFKNSNNDYVLTLEGLLKAVCFYNYSESTEEHLSSFDPKALKKFLGKETDFQIYDYFNFIRFLAFSRDKMAKYLSEKKLDTLDKNSFKDLMLNHVCSDYDTFIKQSIGIESRQFNPNKEDFLKCIMRSADSLFASKEEYSLADFYSLKKDILRELYTYEFKNFKLDNNAIDGVEFARSIVKYAQNNQKRKLLRRVNAIEKTIEEIKISQSEYVDFHFQLQVNMKKLKSTLKSKGVLTRQEIKEVLNQRDVKVTDGQVDVLFRLLDSDDSGFVQKREVLGVISALGHYWTVKEGETSMIQLAKQRWKRMQEKLVKIQEIIMEQ